MRILLLGANGQLGQTFLHQGGLAAFGQLIPATRDGRLVEGGTCQVADLSDLCSLNHTLDQLQPELIINAAAYTAVDRAEDEEQLAMRINGEAVGLLGQWAATHGAMVVHYSTDYVFDGRAHAPYDVDAPTSPLGAYGRSKLAGEEALRASGAAHFIFRTAWVYAPHGRNFLRTMLRLGAERDELKVVADQHGTPTTTELVVQGSLAALKRWREGDYAQRAELHGTYHLVASGETTWHGFAEAIMDEALGKGLLSRRPRIAAISTTEFPTPARRPERSVLDNRRFISRFDFKLPDWRTGLRKVIAEVDSID